MRAKRSVEAREDRHINAKRRGGESLHPRFPRVLPCARSCCSSVRAAESPRSFRQLGADHEQGPRQRGGPTSGVNRPVTMQRDFDITDLYPSRQGGVFFTSAPKNGPTGENRRDLDRDTSFMKPTRRLSAELSYPDSRQGGQRSETEYICQAGADAPRSQPLRQGRNVAYRAFPKAAILLFDTEANIRAESRAQAGI
jgi:hypothetical protein